jgi:hypothetical protein
MVCRNDQLATEYEVGYGQMNPVNLITDSYERKARLYPGLLLVAPIVIILIGMSSAKLSKLESLGTALAGCGGAFLMAQLARDAGKKCEKSWFEAWGGMPSVAAFRHREGLIDSITKARYHAHLTVLVKDAKAPTLEEEAADPSSADQVYSAWSSYLRVHTRDTKKFPLVFKENISYGFRRNVCGLRPIGIVVSSLSFAAGVAWLYHLHLSGVTATPEAIGALACALVFLLLWVFRFTPDWVRIPADAYAERLAETVDSMNGGLKATKARAKKGTA